MPCPPLVPAASVVGAPPFPSAVAALVVEGVGPRRTEDRPAARQDSPDRLYVKGNRVPFQRTVPAVTEADELISVLLYALADHGTDDSVQAGAVAATGEDSHSHGGNHSPCRAAKDGP